MKSAIEWREVVGGSKWDAWVSSLNGHPLQSAQWGYAKKMSTHINDRYWVALKDERPIFLARFEERRILKFIKIAWVPRGPIFYDLNHENQLLKEFLRRLLKNHYYFCVINPWRKVNGNNNQSELTIWVDLTVGKDKLWGNLSKKFRYEVRSAKKQGLVIEKSINQNDSDVFYEMCKTTSKFKGFSWDASPEQLNWLLHKEINEHREIEFCLFIAKYEGKHCGGALVAKAANSVHYIWSGMDRIFSKLSIGESLQWTILEWAVDNHAQIYDLEGIDKNKNFGTYQFKKKLGGEIVNLYGLRLYLFGCQMHFFEMINHLKNLFNKIFCLKLTRNQQFY